MGILLLLELLIFGFLAYAFYRKGKNGICKSKKRLDGMTCLVTGGTSGIGLEVSIDFAMRGARVIVACPFEEEGINAKKKIIEESGNIDVVFKMLDLASFKSVRKFASDILNTEGRLDILMNNAGLSGFINIDSEDGINVTMQVNYLGHFLLTLLLLPLLKKSGTPSSPSRIVNTSSVSHRLARLDVDNFPASKSYLRKVFIYANSKLCLVIFSRELKKMLGDSNVVINNADPGEVGTKIYLGNGSSIFYILYCIFLCIGKSPYEGAQTLLHVALDEKAGQTSGLSYRDCKPYISPKASFDEELARKIWDKSLELLQLGDVKLF